MVNQVQLNRIERPVGTAISRTGTVTTGVAFSQVLEKQLQGGRGLRFSAHALQRMESRKLTLTAAEAAQVADVVDQAAAKGARETLVLTDRMALVVGVPSRTVITVVPKSDLSNTVFTNIDSAVVLPPSSGQPTQEHSLEARGAFSPGLGV